jgi:hypothetical protein
VDALDARLNFLLTAALMAVKEAAQFLSGREVSAFLCAGRFLA